MRLPFETILFDIDGTLIDSNDAHAQAWTQAFREEHVDAAFDDVRRLVGMGGDKLLPAIAGVSEDSELGKAIAKHKKEIFGKLLPGLRATRGARDLLEFLREQDVTLAVATSADDREVSALLKQAGVNDFFPERASKDDAEESKPDPDIVQAAIKKARARPESTVLVGDTPYDLEAAERAGVKAIAVRCGGYWPDADLRGAIRIVDDPAALLAVWLRANRE